MVRKIIRDSARIREAERLKFLFDAAQSVFPDAHLYRGGFVHVGLSGDDPSIVIRGIAGDRTVVVNHKDAYSSAVRLAQEYEAHDKRPWTVEDNFSVVD